MEGFLILFAFTIVAFVVLTFFRRFCDSFILIAFAIGCAVNANIYTAFDKPVVFGPFTFGIDSMLFAIFTFTVIVKFIHYPRKHGQTLAVSTVIAVIISAFIEFFACLSSQGYSDQILRNLLSYLLSALSTLIGVWLMILVYELMKKRNVSRFIIIPVCMLVGCVINNTATYCTTFYIKGSEYVQSTFISILYSSNVELLFCICLAELSYFINTKYWLSKEIIQRELEGRNK